jgi:2-phosphosulfolactate phosphatase
MNEGREICVSLVPQWATPQRLQGCIAVVIDVLRATTTLVHALAAGCREVRPCAEVEEARDVAATVSGERVLLAGERGGQPLPGFDLGNSPRDFVPTRCRGAVVVLTTSNGTRALLQATAAERVLIAAFVNFSAVCEQLARDPRPVHMVCAGDSGEAALEDTLLAGALVEFLTGEQTVRLNDGARIAWDCFSHHGRVLDGALEVSSGGARLRALGYDEDVRAAGRIDLFALVPELRRDPLRVEIGAAGIVKHRWLS